MIESYLRYNEEVKEYFQNADNLLVINLEKGDGWDKLCRFLDVGVPNIDFPHANQQIYSPEGAKMMKKKRALKNDLGCQACHEITTLKKKTSALTPRRRISKITTQKLQNSLVARRLLYGTYCALRYLAAPFQFFFSSDQKRVEQALPENELAVVSCFFNPGGSTRRVENFRIFLLSMKKSGVRCLVVELAFGSAPFAFSEHEDVIQVRTNDVLWHKERLLNIGIRKLLSDGVRKIAWLDGDIVFEDPTWPLEIAKRLEHKNLCQVFDSISIHAHESGPPMIGPSAVKYFEESGALYSQKPSRIRNLARGLLKGGQSGFGWAARAEVFEKVLLFENAVVGGGDKLMFAASLAKDQSDPRFQALTHSKYTCKACGHKNRSDAFTVSFLEWAQQWSTAVDGSVDYARLRIRDMYHGKRSDRGYMARHDILYRNKFDPAVDLLINSSNCFEWSPGKERLGGEVEAYFLSRREDS